MEESVFVGRSHELQELHEESECLPFLCISKEPWLKARVPRLPLRGVGYEPV
jgi:hypothetical protein